MNPYQRRGGGLGFTQLWGFALSGMRLVENFKEYRRRDEQEARIQESLFKVEEAHSFLTDPAPSGLLGNAALATLQDAHQAGLLDPQGFYLGAQQGTPLFYNGNAHLLTYARTGGGKGRDVILPNLAHVKDKSIVVVDVKDGENAYASALHRARSLGQKIVFLNPWNCLGAVNTRLNPLGLLMALAKAGERVELAAKEIALILVPLPKKASDNAWVAQGAQRILAAYMTFLAYERPEDCRLSSLWRFVNQGNEGLAYDLGEMAACSHLTVSGPAHTVFSLIEDAPKQWEAYRSEMQGAVDAYEPGSELEAATDADDFDPSTLKTTPATVYLMTPSGKLGVAAQWISLVTNHLIETIAAQTGEARTLFLLDEFAQLPPMPGMTKALRLYRGRGIQLWFFCQGRFSLQERYPPEIVKEIEDQADVLQMWGIEDPSLLKDVEAWSGKTTVAVRGVNHNGGQVEGLSKGISEHARAVLQVEDIRAVGHGRQILKLPGHPLFVIERIPFYEIDPFRDQLRDVRDVARGEAQVFPV